MATNSKATITNTIKHPRKIQTTLLISNIMEIQATKILNHNMATNSEATNQTITSHKAMETIINKMAHINMRNMGKTPTMPHHTRDQRVNKVVKQMREAWVQLLLEGLVADFLRTRQVAELQPLC